MPMRPTSTLAPSILLSRKRRKRISRRLSPVTFSSVFNEFGPATWNK
jgi:hypothetical protein